MFSTPSAMPFVGEQRAEIVAGDEFGQLVVGHFRIDRHALDRR